MNDGAGETHHHDHTAAPPPSSGTKIHHMMMHMSFFWGKNAEILFNNWPGNRSSMYVLALVFVFFLAFAVEFLSHSRFIKEDSNNAAAVGLIRTLLHTIRIVMSYLVMLAVMSFNVGVFLAAVGGHCFGFFLFGSRFFKKFNPSGKNSESDLPPMTC